MELNYPQIVVSMLLSTGFVSGIFALLTKSMWSPESKNDLARMGNEFARQLLADAKSEREELRLTIHELEDLDTKNRNTIARLQKLLEDKNRKIQELERRLNDMAQKLHSGTPISLRDIFGDSAPDHPLGPSPEAV